MIVTKMKKKALIFLTIASMVVSQAAFGFAEGTDVPSGEPETNTKETTKTVVVSGSSESTSINGKITTKSKDDEDSGVVGLDFLISESILMRIQNDQSLMDVSDLTVTNRMEMGTIQVSDIKITADNGWVLTHKHELSENDGTYNEATKTYSYFANKETNSKEFYLAVKDAEGNVLEGDDIDEGTVEGTGEKIEKSCEYKKAFPQKNNETPITVKFEGHTGPVDRTIDEEKVANIVVTVSQVEDTNASQETVPVS
jgi:hypothetical protein